MTEKQDLSKNLSHGLNQNSNGDIFSLLDEDLSLDFSAEEIESIKKESTQYAEEMPIVKEEEILDTEKISELILFGEDKMKIIEEYVLLLEKSKKEDIQELNREIHGLKGEFGMAGAKTLQLLLHTIEEYTGDFLHGYKNLEDITPVVQKVFVKSRELFSYLCDGTYEDRLNKEKEILPTDDYLDKTDHILSTIHEQISALESDTSNKSALDILHDNIHSLYAGLDFSRLKKHIHISESLIDNIETDKEILETNLPIIKQNILSFSKMIDAIIDSRLKGEEGKDYYEKAMGSDLQTTSKKRPKDDSHIWINIDVLNNLLREVDEARLNSTLVKSTLYILNNALKDLQDVTERKSQNLRDLEKESNSRIQSSSDIIVFNTKMPDEKKENELEEIGNKKSESNDDFDPLEKDRYKTLQTLTSSLIEAQIDLEEVLEAITQIKNIQENYSESLEESIINAQDILTRTRLIPFYEKGSSDIRTSVRDSATSLGKKVKVEIQNERIEIDRVILEKLKPQIGHTIRNSVAHGIESPETRLALGKPETGLITVNLHQEGGRLTITIKDDGAGINVKKVREKAIEKNLWDASKPMSDAEAVDMICMPDFSTVDKEDVNLVAGRGIGMDAVKNEILSMGGRYDIESEQGKGMKVEIQIPTSISTVSTLLVSVGSEILAIPVDVIEKITSIDQEEIKVANNKGFIKVDGKNVDFKYLNNLAKIEVPQLEMMKYKNLIVTSGNGVSIAVMVDKLLGVYHVPIKTISRTLSNIPGVISATILSDGKAAFVYDPTRAKVSLLRYYGLTSENDKEIILPNNLFNNKKHEQIEEKYLVMVVDDSNTVRQHTARFLTKNGYNHLLAKDGKHGIDLLASNIPDVILLDVEMPKMDGFDFARHVREHERYHDIPIIMITSRSGDKHRNRAMEIGVNEYITKPFNEDELLSLLKKYTSEFVK